MSGDCFGPPQDDVVPRSDELRRLLGGLLAVTEVPAQCDPRRRSAVDNHGMQPAIYILTNKSNRVLYVGVTADLRARYGSTPST